MRRVLQVGDGREREMQRWIYEGLMSHMLVGTLEVVYQSLEAAKSIQRFCPVHREHLMHRVNQKTRKRGLFYISRNESVYFHRNFGEPHRRKLRLYI